MAGSAVAVRPAMASKVLPVMVQLTQPCPSIAATGEFENEQLAMVPRSAAGWMEIAGAAKFRSVRWKMDTWLAVTVRTAPVVSPAASTVAVP
jgi:hypothetical protein